MGSNHCMGCKNNCCVHEHGGTFVTLQEAERIADALNAPVDDVCTFAEDKGLQQDDDYLDYFNLMVRCNGKVLPLAYKRHILMLKKKPGRWECPFLTERGCSIPELRPAYCHVFPFWFKAVNDSIVLFPMNAPTKSMETCMIRKACFNDRTHNRMIQEMGETKEGLLKMLANYVEEIKQYQEYAPQLYNGMLPSEVIMHFRRGKHL